ncbi:MAG TPA: hypothetical protein VET26_02025 [Candidatus Sulfotelmatobacter sp.]|nr:hypothetical protein [Candidatus Sulfotelmatobacter sp.]
MVGDDHGQLSGREHGPEPFSIRGGSERGSAFPSAAEALEVVLDVDEVVRARLASHVDSPPARLSDQLDAVRGAHVHHVQHAAGLAGDSGRLLDGVMLRLRWS